MGSTNTAHSTYWLGKDWLKTMPNPNSPEYLMRLSNIRRATGDFVKIVTGKDIPVKFSSGAQSYTDGSTSVVISAVTKPEDIDVSVGLALHEASHVLLSQPLFQWLRDTLKSLYAATLNPRINKIIASNPALTLHEQQVKSILHTMINLLEDRRIDSWMYERIGGYRPYYDALYEHYLTGEPYSTMRNAPQMRVPTIKNYEFWVILTLSGYNDDLSVLPELDKIIAIADTKNIRRFDKDNYSQPIPKIVEAALQIVEIIVRNSKSLNDSKQKQDQQNQQDGAEGDSKTPWGDSLDNMDFNHDGEEAEGDDAESEAKPKKRGRPSKAEKAAREFSDKEIADAVEELQKFVDNALDKEALSAEKNQLLGMLEEAGAKVVNTGESDGIPTINTMIYQNCTDAVIRSDHFPFGGSYVSPQSELAVSKGFKLGNVLAQRIKVMQDEYNMKIGRQPHGKLDKRMIASLGFGNEAVFAVTHTIRHKPVFVHLSLDASGSMWGGERWENALKLAVALAVAADKTRTMDVAISLRAGVSGLSGRETSGVALVYDSRKDNISKVRNSFKYLRTAGGTPEGLAFQAILDKLVLTNNDQRKFFINISDGEPAFTNYGGTKALEHTRKQVQLIRNSGVKVLSYFVGGQYSAGDFRTMYGKDAAIIDPSSIAQITNTLNKLFFQE